jgi:hypothetical protein
MIYMNNDYGNNYFGKNHIVVHRVEIVTSGLKHLN